MGEGEGEEEQEGGLTEREWERERERERERNRAREEKDILYHSVLPSSSSKLQIICRERTKRREENCLVCW